MQGRRLYEAWILCVNEDVHAMGHTFYVSMSFRNINGDLGMISVTLQEVELREITSMWVL